MSKNTVGNILSRIRSQVKAVRQDSMLTDRLIYSFVLKHAKWLMKREDGKNKLMSFSSVMQTMDFVELEEVDKVQSMCVGLSSDCTIKRTKAQLPIFLQGYYGPLVRTVASLDGSEELQPILPSTYLALSKSKNFKYNKTKYYWFLDNYMYFPNLDWDGVRIEGIFEDDISLYTCADDSCVTRTDLQFNVPDYLHGEVESAVLKDLIFMYQLPSDNSADKQNPLR
jgi:hypothetical protein